MPASNVDYARVVVISANIQSLLEEPSKIAQWSQAVGKEVSEQKPLFAAIHLQGAKSNNSRGTEETVDHLIQELDCQPGFELFTCSRHFHDVENSGLSSIYYSKDEPSAALYDHERKEYSPAIGHRHEQTGSNFIKKEKLSTDGYFSGKDSPSCSMTRWLLFDKPFNFVNVTLTPDQSPLEGCQKSPSESAVERKKQLNTIINQLQNKNLWDDDATFIAGDFGTSLNKSKLLEDQLNTNHAAIKTNEASSDKPFGIEARNMSGKKIFQIDEKKFDMLDLHDWLFHSCNGQLVRKYDQELSLFKSGGLICEPSIYFPPNSPYGYDRRTDADRFAKSDCPAWKNRVLVNGKAWEMMHKNSFSGSSVYYGLIGQKLDIGKHKPVSIISTICLK